MGSRVFEPSAPSSVRVVPCKFSGFASPGCQTTFLPSTVNRIDRLSFVNGSSDGWYRIARDCVTMVSQPPGSTEVGFDLRHRQPPIDEHQRRVILKLARSRPFHANQLRRQHREPRVADRHNGLRICHRIVRQSHGSCRCPHTRWMRRTRRTCRIRRSLRH